MINSEICEEAFGSPEVTSNQGKYMVLYYFPEHLAEAIKPLPSRLYMNQAMVLPLTEALQNIVDRGLCDEFETFDGIFNIRKAKGYNGWSLHSWGVAIDINAKWNGWNKTPEMSPELVACFKDAGFDWGGDWKSTPDGMHFQLKEL